MRYYSIIFLCWSAFMSAQNDSIQVLLDNSIQKDSLYISRLIDLSDSYDTGNVNKQIRLLRDAERLAKTNNDSLQLATIYQRLSRANNSKGVYDVAIASALSAKLIYDNIGTQNQQLLANSSLITIYRNNGYSKKAIALSKENLKLIKNLPIDRNTGRYYFDLGVSYSVDNQLDLALVYYKKATELAKRVNFKLGEMFMKQSTAQLYKKMGRYSEAENMFKELLGFFEGKNDKSGIARINYGLATIYSLKSQHQKSIPFYETSLKLNREMNRLEFIKDINQKLFIAYNIVQDTAKANRANEEYNVMKDTLDSRERKALLAEMATKYETEKIEAQSQLNAKEAELSKAESRQNMFYFIGALVLLVLVLAVAFINSKRLKQKQQTALITQQLKASQKQLALEKQYRDSELKALKAQMNPHFIFNVLNSIQEFIVLNEKEKASEYLATFAELIRNYLNFSNEEFITLHEEVETITNYLELEHLRFGDDLKYSIHIEENLDKNSITLPTMLIQPYIENSLKHGLFNKEGDKRISILLEKTSDNDLFCVVEDNGVGRKASAEHKASKSDAHKSFASVATKERLELLNQRYHSNIGVNIVDIETENQTGTRVELTIPIKIN